MTRPGSIRASRRLLGLLAGVVVVMAAVGGLLFVRFTDRVERDPGYVYRNPRVMEQMLERARTAERAGDRASAMATYRFVVEVGSQGDPEQLRPYVVTARAALKRLGGSPGIQPNPPR